MRMILFSSAFSLTDSFPWLNANLRNCHQGFFVPYKVIRRVGPVVYELELPPASREHLIAYGRSLTTSSADLPLNDDWELILSPSKVLAHHWVHDSGLSVLELLVQCNGCPIEEASWEDYDFLQSQFPTFCLDDKAHFQEGGGY